MKERNSGIGGNEQQENPSLAELSRQFIDGKISREKYLGLEKQLSPRFGFQEIPKFLQPQTPQRKSPQATSEQQPKQPSRVEQALGRLIPRRAK